MNDSEEFTNNPATNENSIQDDLDLNFSLYPCDGDIPNQIKMLCYWTYCNLCKCTFNFKVAESHYNGKSHKSNIDKVVRMKNDGLRKTSNVAGSGLPTKGKNQTQSRKRKRRKRANMKKTCSKNSFNIQCDKGLTMNLSNAVMTINFFSPSQNPNDGVRFVWNSDSNPINMVHSGSYKNNWKFGRLANEGYQYGNSGYPYNERGNSGGYPHISEIRTDF